MLKTLHNKYGFIIDLLPYTSFGLIRDITNIYSKYFKYSNDYTNKGNSHDSDKKIEYMNYSNMFNVNTNTNTTEQNMIDLRLPLSGDDHRLLLTGDDHRLPLSGIDQRLPLTGIDRRLPLSGELIQADNGYYWITNNTDIQNEYVYDITNQEDNDTYFSKRYTKAVIKNTNWCDYCLDYFFMHRVSIEKFIAKCSDRFNKNHIRFFQGKEAHMLGTILTIDKTAKGYLRGINMGLHNYYGSVNYKNDAQDFTIGGIVEQYNERAYSNTININNGHNHNSDYHDWLMKNNITCSECERMACPFHYDNMGFNNYNICGLCVDGNSIPTNSKSITKTNSTPNTNSTIDLDLIDLDLIENHDLYD